MELAQVTYCSGYASILQHILNLSLLATTTSCTIALPSTTVSATAARGEQSAARLEHSSPAASRGAGHHPSFADIGGEDLQRPTKRSRKFYRGFNLWPPKPALNRAAISSSSGDNLARGLSPRSVSPLSPPRGSTRSKFAKLRKRRDNLRARLSGPYPHREITENNENTGDSSAGQDMMPNSYGDDKDKSWDHWSQQDFEGNKWRADDAEELNVGYEGEEDEDEKMQAAAGSVRGASRKDVARSSSVKEELTAEDILERDASRSRQDPGGTPGQSSRVVVGFKDGDIINTAQGDMVFQANGWRLPYGQSHRSESTAKDAKMPNVKQEASASADEYSSAAEGDSKKTHRPRGGGPNTVSFNRPPDLSLIHI